MTETTASTLSPRSYEAAFLERLTWQFSPPMFRVEGTRNGVCHRRMGRSGVPRQLDAAVYHGDHLVLVAEVKRHDTRSLEIGTVDEFIGVLEDVGCRFGILVGPRGFAAGAEKRAAAAQIELRTFTHEDALEAELLPLARSIYPCDWAYHPQLAAAVLAIRQGKDWGEITEALEGVPFDEWEGFAQHAMIDRPDEASVFLQAIALNHHDDGWRFNAARILVDGGRLDDSLRSVIAEREATDADFLALLKQV